MRMVLRWWWWWLWGDNEGYGKGMFGNEGVRVPFFGSLLHGQGTCVMRHNLMVLAHGRMNQ